MAPVVWDDTGERLYQCPLRPSWLYLIHHPDLRASLLQRSFTRRRGRPAGGAHGSRARCQRCARPAAALRDHTRLRAALPATRPGPAAECACRRLLLRAGMTEASALLHARCARARRTAERRKGRQKGQGQGRGRGGRGADAGRARGTRQAPVRAPRTASKNRCCAGGAAATGAHSWPFLCPAVAAALPCRAGRARDTLARGAASRRSSASSCNDKTW